MKESMFQKFVYHPILIHQYTDSYTDRTRNTRTYMDLHIWIHNKWSLFSGSFWLVLIYNFYEIHFPTMKPIGKKQSEAKVNNEAEYAAPAAEVEKAAESEKIDFSNVEIEPLFKDFVDFETFSKADYRAVKVLACEAVPKSKKLLKFTLDDGSGTPRTILSGIHAYYEPEELIGKTCVAITNLPPRPMMGLESCGMLLSALHKENGEERLNLLMLDPHIPAGAKLY